jgi:serine/threonine protein kinase
MVTGTEPFKGNVESEVFRNILERKLVLPMQTDSDAADLIDRLLTLDSKMRIGCGKEGYAELKNHNFFKGINWKTITKTSPPLP